MKYLEVFEIYKTKSINKTSDSIFNFFDSSFKKVDQFESYDIFSNNGKEFYIVENQIPFIFLEYKMDSIVIQDSDVVFPVIQFYTLRPEFRNTGKSLIAYDWLLAKHGNMLSDYIQSKGDMSVWVKLFNKYHVTGYDAKKYKIVDDIYINEKELASHSIRIYNSANRLMILAAPVGLE